MAAEDFDAVGHGGAADAFADGFEAQDGLGVDAFAEGHFAHAHGDEVAAGVVAAHGHPRDFVHPHEHFAAEKEPVVVEVAGHHEFVGGHGAVLPGAGAAGGILKPRPTNWATSRPASSATSTTTTQVVRPSLRQRAVATSRAPLGAAR